MKSNVRCFPCRSVTQNICYFPCPSVNTERTLLSMPISQHRTYVTFHADQSTQNICYFPCRSVNTEHTLLSMPISQHRTYVTFHADQSTQNVCYFPCRSVNTEHTLLSMPISQHRTYIAFHADQSTKTQTNLNSIKSVRRSITSEGHDTGVAQEKRCTQPAVSSTNIGTPTTLEHQNSIRMLFLTPLRHSEPPAIGLIYVRWQ